MFIRREKKCALLGYVLTHSNINTYKIKICIYMQTWFPSSILNVKRKILIITLKLDWHYRTFMPCKMKWDPHKKKKPNCRKGATLKSLGGKSCEIEGGSQKIVKVYKFVIILLYCNTATCHQSYHTLKVYYSSSYKVYNYLV